MTGIVLDAVFVRAFHVPAMLVAIRLVLPWIHICVNLRRISRFLREQVDYGS